MRRSGKTLRFRNNLVKSFRTPVEEILSSVRLRCLMAKNFKPRAVTRGLSMTLKVFKLWHAAAITSHSWLLNSAACKRRLSRSLKCFKRTVRRKKQRQTKTWETVRRTSTSNQIEILIRIRLLDDVMIRGFLGVAKFPFWWFCANGTRKPLSVAELYHVRVSPNIHLGGSVGQWEWQWWQRGDSVGDRAMTVE